MNVVEPCCYKKQLNEFVEKMEHRKEGTEQVVHFFSNSDWSTDELLDYVAHAVPFGDLTVCLIKPAVNTIRKLRMLMSEQLVADAENGIKRPLVSHLNLITQPQREGDAIDQRAEIQSQLGEFIEAQRMTVCEDVIGFRCICIANERRHWVIQGSLNQQKNYAMQLFTMTVSKETYRQVMEILNMKVRMKSIYKKKKE